MRRKLVALVVILAMMVPVQVFAQGAIDLNKDISLTVNCTYENTAIAGMTLDIYRMGDVDEVGNYSVADAFNPMEEYIDFSRLGDDNGDKLASTLAAYVGEEKGVNPTGSGTTDASGNFTVKGKPGMYLVVGHKVVDGNVEYEINPFLVAVPDRDSKNNSWNYSVTAYPKAVAKDVATELSVVKIWMDENENNRPHDITVILLKDGKEYEKVKLSKDNDWTHTWKNLDGNSEWKVREVAVTGYKVEIGESETGYVITNTDSGYTPPPEENNLPGTKLPQTGQLWWPVLALLLCGLSFIAVGLFRRKRSSER